LCRESEKFFLRYGFRFPVNENFNRHSSGDISGGLGGFQNTVETEKNGKRLHPPKKTGYAMLPHENFPPHNQRVAQERTTMIRAYPYTEILQVSCMTPPNGAHVFRRLFQLFQPVSRIVLGSLKAKTCELNQNVKRRQR